MHHQSTGHGCRYVCHITVVLLACFQLSLFSLSLSVCPLFYPYLWKEGRGEGGNQLLIADVGVTAGEPQLAKTLPPIAVPENRA